MHNNATLSKEMALGSCTCIGRSVCIRPDKECRFTSLCSHADVEPKSKCYGVSPGVQVHRLLSTSPIPTSPIPTPPGLPPIPQHTSSFPCTPSTSPLLCPFPPFSGRSCSIPAGPCLFISSEAAMINEALNTSSLSPGPGEPHS